MGYDFELKFTGEEYAGGFSNGLTLSGSGTRQGFELVEEKNTEMEQVSLFRNEAGVEVELHVGKKGECEEVYTVVKNKSREEVTMELLSSLVLRGVVADKIHRLQSFWSAEGKLRSESILDLHMEPSWNRCGMRVEKFGNTGSMPVRKYFPFLALEDTVHKKVVGIQLYLASSWQMEILCKEDDSLTVSCGIADRDFGHWLKRLKSGEEFVSPKAVVTGGKDLYEVCDKLVKAQKPQISAMDPHMDILFNEYCTTWGNPSFENVKKICDKIAGKGIKFLVIDSGWYGKDTWWNSIGDWEVNEEKFPGGMKPMADYIRSRGMIPGLWYEIESLAKESVYYHRSEFLLCKDGVPLTVGGRRFWDMENPWVIEYLSKKIIDLLKSCGFGYLKVDYNDTLGIGVDGAESLGEGLRKKVQATRSFFQKIQEEIPGIVLENCSSGGHRLEPSMMEICSQASFSDAHETQAIPLIAANMHRVIPPKQSQIWAVMRKEDNEQRIYYSLVATFLGRMCLSGDIYNLSDKQWKWIEEGMDFYRQVSEIIEKGKTTRISVTGYTGELSYNKPQGQQVVLREYEGKGLCLLHRFEKSSVAFPQELQGKKILASYGKADGDFSAIAYWYEG